MVYYKKNHWYNMVIDYCKILKKYWAAIIVVIIPSLPFGILGTILVFLLIGVFCVLRWTNEYIVMDGESVFYKRGIVLTESIRIPLKSVSLVEFNRNIFYSIFGLQIVKLESISPKDKKFDITMTLKKDTVLEFRKLFIRMEDLTILDSSEIEAKRAYKISVRHLFILATLRSNIIVGVGIIYSIIHIVSEVDKQIGIELKTLIIDNIEFGIYSSHELFEILFYFSLFLILIISIIMLFSILGIMSKYYKFRLYRKNNHIYINHGLLVRKRYTIKVDNIHAIKVEQNIINQLLGLYAIKASVVGYGNQMNEDAVMFPLCTRAEFEHIINEFVPEFNFLGDIYHPPKKTFNNFYISWTSYSVVFAMLLYYYFDEIIPGLIVIGIMILWRFLIKKNSSLGTDKDVLYFSSGSFIRRITLIRDTSMVQCIKVVNLFQRRKKICDYRIKFYNQKKLEWIRVKNMDDKLYKNIVEKMKRWNDIGGENNE